MNEYYRIDTNITLSEKIDNDTVVINLTNGCYFNFNPTATVIWDMLGCGFSKEDIINGYSELFSIPITDSTSEVNRIVDFLVENGLVTATEIRPVSIDLQDINTTYIKPEIEKFDDMQEMLLLDPIHEVIEKGWPYKSDE